MSSIELPFVRPNWDAWFMAQAFLISQRSLDPSKNGCVVVDSERTILSVGYNSPPRGCDDTQIPLTRPEKYMYMEHAESNAIVNAARSGMTLKGSTFYVTGKPCNECFRKIINVGAVRVIYGNMRARMLNEDIDHATNLILHDQPIDVIEFKDTESMISLLNQTITYINDRVEK